MGKDLVISSNYLVITSKDLVITRKDPVNTRKDSYYEKRSCNNEKRSHYYEKKSRYFELIVIHVLLLGKNSLLRERTRNNEIIISLIQEKISFLNEERFRYYE